MGEGYREYHIFTYSQEDIDKWGWSNFYLDNGVEGDFDWEGIDLEDWYLKEVAERPEIYGERFSIAASNVMKDRGLL